MCKVTDYINSKDLSHLYNVILSQLKFFKVNDYHEASWKIYSKQSAIWERLDCNVNSDFGVPGVVMISLHLHLGLSKHTSPYFIVKELREYISSKLGDDVFHDWKFEKWQEQFPNKLFVYEMERFKNILV